MSVLTSNSQNRLLKSTTIRTGKSTTRQGMLTSYSRNVADTSLTLAGFTLRILAICGLFLAMHLIIQPEPTTLTAKPISAALFSVRNGSGTIARANGQVESVVAGTVGTVLAGDMIVAEDGMIWLSFPNGQSVVLDSGASITIEQLQIANGIQRVQVVVWSGRVQYATSVENKVEDYFYVSSTSSSSRISAGRMSLDVVSPQQTVYTVLTGTATIQMETQTVQLQASQQLTAQLGDRLVVAQDSLAERRALAELSEDALTDVTTKQMEAPANQVLLSNNALAVDPSTINSTEFTNNESYTPMHTHEVKSGDTIWSIALLYGSDMDSILGANPIITDSNLLYVGQQISIPTDIAMSTGIGTN